MHTSISGPSPIRWMNGCESVLCMGRKVCEPCTLVQCEVRGTGKGMRCVRV